MTTETFVRACGLSELEVDIPKRVEIGTTPISIVRTESEVFAIYDICSHANVSLSEGEVDDCTIECWLRPRRAPSPYTP
jgi:3-phenylpropionate/trans-cinnamate dioxygenase ferredoxin subunit